MNNQMANDIDNQSLLGNNQPAHPPPSQYICSQLSYKEKRNVFVLLGSIFTIVAVGVISALVIGRQRGNARTTGTFLHISDLHFDPLYNASLSKTCNCHISPGMTNTSINTCSEGASRNSYGQDGCDSPIDLIRSAFKHAGADSSVSFLFITGDMMRHDTAELTNNQLLNMAQTIVDLVHVSFPHISQLHFGISVIGNNDAVSDYYFNIGDTEQLFMHQLGSILAPYMPADGDAIKSFSSFGYYSQTILPGLKVVSLNTLVYSSHHVPVSTSVADPLDQFAWLASQLQSALEVKQSVYIIGHIPPGIDKYAHVATWFEAYTTQYLGLVSKYADVIKGQFFGHYHQK